MCTGTHPYIPVVDVAEVKLLYSTTGGEALNVLNFHLPATPNLALLEQLAGDVKQWFRDNMIPMSNSGCALQQIIVTDLTTQHGPQWVETTDLPIACTGGSSMPNNVTVAVTHSTHSRGRSYRGRSYVVGPPTTAVDHGDVVAPVYAAALVTAFDNLLIGDFATNSEQLVIVSRCQDKAWLTTAIQTLVTSNACEGTIDSQRRRLLGRGI